MSEFSLSVNRASDTVGIPIRIWERYLTMEVEEAEVQAIGHSLQITIRSEREDITMQMPFKKWQTSHSTFRRFGGANSGLLSVGTFMDNIQDHGAGEVRVEIEKLDEL